MTPPYFVYVIFKKSSDVFCEKCYGKYGTNQNNKKISYLFDDLYDEIIYIDDLLNLKLERINYILEKILMVQLNNQNQ